MKTKLLLMMCFLGFATSCQDDDGGSSMAKERKDIILSRSEEVLAEENMDFAFRFFKQVNSTETEKPNWIVSPLSASLALGMMTNGAAGNTLEEMKSTLGFSDFDLDEMNAYNKRLVAELLDLDNTTKLSIANSIWLNNRFQVYDSFVDLNKNMYNAEVSNLDFTSQDAVDYINNWCANHTNNTINGVVDVISPTTNAFLLNALYFKGIWQNKFKASDTKKEPFANYDGNKVEVQMMNQKGSFNYFYTDNFCVAKFPYGNAAFCMAVLLPNEGESLEELLEDFNYENWKEWNQRAYWQELIVKLPRFEMSYDKDLMEDMQDMGMKDAFTDAADFASLSPSEHFYLSIMTQYNYIKVNEEGTEAASITKITGDLAANPKVPEPFYVNRPFVFMIMEQSTGTILFMGKVTKL